MSCRWSERAASTSAAASASRSWERPDPALRPGPAARPERPATGGRRSPPGWIKTAGKGGAGSGGKEFFRGALGKVPDPPVGGGPKGVAPGGRAAATTELEPAVERHVHLDVVAAVSTRVADSDEAGGLEVLNTFRGDLSELFSAGRALLEHRHECGGSAKQLLSGHGGVRSPGRRRNVAAHGANA